MPRKLRVHVAVDTPPPKTEKVSVRVRKEVKEIRVPYRVTAAPPVRTVPVSERALIQRINRVLASDDQKVVTTRGARAILDLGYYYVLDWRRNLAVQTDLDLESFGRELGCLKPWERLEE